MAGAKAGREKRVEGRSSFELARGRIPEKREHPGLRAAELWESERLSSVWNWAENWRLECTSGGKEGSEGVQESSVVGME